MLAKEVICVVEAQWDPDDATFSSVDLFKYFCICEFQRVGRMNEGGRVKEQQ